MFQANWNTDGSWKSGDGRQQMENIAKLSQKFQWTLIPLLVFLWGAFSSFYQINPNQQGVVTRLGAFHKISDEGPHFKIPFGIDQVYKVAVTKIYEEQFGFRKGSFRLSDEQARLESLMLTGDLKVAVVEWILQYKISDPKKFLFHAVAVKKNIRDITVSIMRRVVGDKLVSDVLTTDRISIAERAKKLTQETLDQFDMGILITNLNLQNVNPPKEVRAAFNEVNIARQEKDQMINQAKGTYNKLVPLASGKARKMISEAEGYAINKVNRAKGEAERFTISLASYQKAPQVTRHRIYLEMMQEVLSKVESLHIIDPLVKGVLPIYQNNFEKKISKPIRSE